jgi:hypothetical protein
MFVRVGMEVELGVELVLPVLLGRRVQSELGRGDSTETSTRERVVALGDRQTQPEVVEDSVGAEEQAPVTLVEVALDALEPPIPHGTVIRVGCCGHTAEEVRGVGLDGCHDLRIE